MLLRLVEMMVGPVGFEPTMAYAAGLKVRCLQPLDNDPIGIGRLPDASSVELTIRIMRPFFC